MTLRILRSILGFEIYDSEEFYTDINGDSLIDVESKKIDTDFKLQKGDILVSNGHIKFYIEDKYVDECIVFGWDNVNKHFPKVAKLPQVLKIGNNCIINCDGNNYTRIYRFRRD